MNGEQRHKRYFAHAKDDLDLCTLCMFKGTYSLDVAHMMVLKSKRKFKTCLGTKEWYLVCFKKQATVTKKLHNDLHLSDKA